MKILHVLAVLFLFFSVGPLAAQEKTDRKLERKLQDLLKGFRGVAGIYVKNLKTGKTVAIRADTVFPTASMVKIPILVGIMARLEAGELKYHQEFMYRDSLLYPGVDILGSFRDSARIELSKTIMLMLTTSDNTASLWLQSIAGGGSRINELLDSLGFTSTRVNSRTPGREANREEFGWGQTTPAEMALFMERMFAGNLYNDRVSSTMLRLLGRNYWDEEALSQIPPTVFVASKNGAVNASRSETLLVIAPHGPYVFSLITKNQEDQSWEPGNEGWMLARKVSRLLWQYFEPRSSWKPYLNEKGE